jgi:ribosomal protein S18 acetylase RimI-like enzyme
MTAEYMIENATTQDLPFIYQLFEEAIAFQKNNNYIGWQKYDKSFLQNDVEQKLLFKMMKGGEIICIYSICFGDVLIWREKERGDAIYLHRIVLNQRFKGEKVFRNVFKWAKGFAKERNLKYIRMDTWADNVKIIEYYKSYGFVFCENYTTANTEALPEQHRNLNVALLEFEL